MTVQVSIMLCAGRSPVALHASLFSLARAARALPAAEIELLVLSDPQAPELIDRVTCDAHSLTSRTIHADTDAEVRQQAVEAARGGYLGHLEAGDLWSGNMLAEAVSALRREGTRQSVWRPEAVISCGLGYYEFNLAAVLQQPMEDAASGADLLHATRLAPSFITHRAVCERIPFPPADAARGWLDVDAWWIADCLAGDVAQRILPGTALYRWNPPQPMQRPARIGPSALFAAEETP